MPREPDRDAISKKIEARLAAAILPMTAVAEVWGGPGESKPCDGCGEIIWAEETQIEANVSINGHSQTLLMHAYCYSLWDLARRGEL
jgi:hypothetical protein